MIRWFELNWGLLFIPLHKKNRYAAYLRKKYGNESM